MDTTPLPAHRASRTRATVMFADLVGFTAMSEREGPERAYAVVTGCLKLLDGIARKYGGAVDKYLGDSLMTVFGYPVPMPEPERSAVEAAVEMRERVLAYNRELDLEPPLEIHIGINTGDMVAGDIRGPVVREFHVLGDCVNVAARLKAKSPLGAIYIGPDTHAATAERFESRDIEPLALKGKSYRIPAFEVLRSRETLFRRSLGSDEILLSELVGRDAELASLRERAAALAAGRGGVVSLLGAEGMGKSRLLAALGAGLEGDVAVLQLRPPPSESRTDLGLLAGLVAAWAGIEPGDGGEEIRTRLGEALARDLPGEDPGLGEALAGLLASRREATSPGPLPEPSRALLRSALRGIVAALAGTQPLLLACEDVGRADAASLAFLEELLSAALELPLLLVLTGRPEGPLAGGPLATALRGLPPTVREEIVLGPLDPASARRLVAEASNDALQGDGLALLESRAGGNPARLLLGVFLTPALVSEQAHGETRAERSSEAERRRSTILFADITGFTAMTEKLGPEAAYPVVAGALRLLDEVARRHGGTVDKYMGDCVMALFGVPEAIEDAPRAAVNAAIEMRKRIQEYNDAKALPLRLDVHTGIHTGMGIAGDISGPLLREFAVMGEPVEVANLLTDRAEAGQVFVGPETWRFTRERFEFNALEPTHLEGRSEEVGCYELLSDREQLHRGRLGAERRIFSDLVGREEEVARLEEALERLRGGEGSIVSLIAEAGVGKSRLVTELRGSAAAEGLGWVEGRSLSNGAQLSYHPFADLVRQWARIDDDDDDDSAQAKLAAALEASLPEAAEELYPLIASVAGMPLEAEQEEELARIQGEAREKRIRNAMTDLVGAGAGGAPTVVVLDDLHWADQSSLELLESLLALAGERPVAFLLVYRPGFVTTSGRILEILRQEHAERHVEIELHPLGAAATRKMLNNLFRQGDIPHSTRATIEEKASGNPFYIEEVVRSLVEQGAVEMDGGRFRATEKIHSVEIPGTIQEVVMARVDRLGLARRQLLQTAAVIGQTFHQEVLGELWSGETRVESELEELVAAEFLVPSDRLQGIEFAFKHPLVHEVTYDGILETRREELHRRVAEAVEKQLSEAIPGYLGMLAYHFSKGRDTERAEAYLFRAGDEAARVAASSEALHFFREASKLYLELHGEAADPAKLALLEKSIARALFHRGQLIEAQEHFDAALESLGEKVPRGNRALLLGAARNVPPMLMELYLARATRRRPPADERQREVVELMFERSKCEITTDPTRFVFDSLDTVAKTLRVDPRTVPLAPRVLAGASVIFSYGGISFSVSRRFLEMARPLARAEEVSAYFQVGLSEFIHHSWQGDWSEEHEVDEAVLQEALREGLLWDGFTYLGTHAEQLLCKGDFARARERLEQVDKLWEQYEHDLGKSTHYALTMYLALEEGRLEDAVAAADAYYEENPEELLHILALGGKAKAQVLLGDLDGAEASLEICQQRVAEAGGSRVPPYQLSGYQRSRLLLDVARLEEAGGARALRRRARRSTRAAFGGAARCALRRTEVYRLAGTLAWLGGDAKGAARWWERSLAEGERLGARPQLARTHAEIGQRLSPVGDEREIRGLGPKAHLDRAADLTAALGLAAL